MNQVRKRRLEELIREEISKMITFGEIKDPRVNSFLSITRVEASQDGSHAKVFVSSLDDIEGILTKQSSAYLMRLVLFNLSSQNAFVCD